MHCAVQRVTSCVVCTSADGRMLEDHTVLSELGDDWGPLVRLALWTRDRRPYRTRGWCTDA